MNRTDYPRGQGTNDRFSDEDSTVEVTPYIENFDDPESPTRRAIEDMLTNGQLEAYFRWMGFDLRSVLANAMDSLGTRASEQWARANTASNALTAAQREMSEAYNLAAELENQGKRLSRLMSR